MTACPMIAPIENVLREHISLLAVHSLLPPDDLMNLILDLICTAKTCIGRFDWCYTVTACPASKPIENVLREHISLLAVHSLLPPDDLMCVFFSLFVSLSATSKKENPDI